MSESFVLLSEPAIGSSPKIEVALPSKVWEMLFTSFHAKLALLLTPLRDAALIRGRYESILTPLQRALVGLRDAAGLGRLLLALEREAAVRLVYIRGGDPPFLRFLFRLGAGGWSGKPGDPDEPLLVVRIRGDMQTPSPWVQRLDAEPGEKQKRLGLERWAWPAAATPVQLEAFTWLTALVAFSDLDEARVVPGTVGHYFELTDDA